ncbi:MAG: type II toxin-antitoxin system VapC family toxin [Acidobacteriota bacterium]|nr:type II toxin-antitoxin system VapC family toxin [Acidobacteriota bacterium]
MPTVTYDTNVFISRNPAYFPAGFVMSAVVMQELAAGAVDSSELKQLNAARRAYEKEGRLLVPTGEDWWQAGKVLNALLRGLKSKRGGLTPKLPDSEKHRIISDVLIAVTARRAGALVVTDNLKDFEKIKHYCDVKVMKAIRFFERKG